MTYSLKRDAARIALALLVVVIASTKSTSEGAP
jgi:hypothetical protein